MLATWPDLGCGGGRRRRNRIGPDRFRNPNSPASKVEIVEAVTIDPSLNYETAIALRRSDIATVKALDAVLDRFASDGTLAGILDKYGAEASAK